MPSAATTAAGGPLINKNGGGIIVSAEKRGGQQQQRERQQPAKLKKLWLHDAVVPALSNGSNHQICRFCGSTLSSPNTTVRKKVGDDNVLYIIRY